MDIQVIYDLLKEVRDEQKNLSEKNQEHREEALNWQSEASNRLLNIEEDLREHKEGVIQNRGAINLLSDKMQEIIKRLTVRIEALEEPKKIREFLTKRYVKFSAFLAATATIAGAISKILGMW